jgi:2'-5' RNA ligase superfamily
MGLRSALVVAVPWAATVVEQWLERTARAKPSNGVPAHVTILFPFVPATEIDDMLLDDLGSLFSRFAAFGVELRDTDRFPGVLYLAPEPAAPFVSLTEAVVGEYPEFPPYGGVRDSIVPHLTAAEGDDQVVGRAEAEIRPWLPITGHVRDVLLLEEVEPDFARWRKRARFELGEP